MKFTYCNKLHLISLNYLSNSFNKSNLSCFGCKLKLLTIPYYKVRLQSYFIYKVTYIENSKLIVICLKPVTFIAAFENFIQATRSKNY